MNGAPGFAACRVEKPAPALDGLAGPIRTGGAETGCRMNGGCFFIQRLSCGCESFMLAAETTHRSRQNPYDSCINIYHMRPYDDSINSSNTSSETVREGPAQQSRHDFFLHKGLDALREQIIATLENGAFCNILTGPPGSGKTRFCTSALGANTAGWQVIFLNNPTVSFHQLLTTIVAHLAAPADNDPVPSEQDPTTALLDHFRKAVLALSEKSAKVVTVIDQAELMFPATLERLQELAAALPEGRPAFSLLLVGSDKLTVQLQQMALRPLQQMITLTSEMPALSRDELPQFVEQVRADAQPVRQQFSSAALDHLYRSSEGYPGRLLLLCHHTGGAISPDATITEQQTHRPLTWYRKAWDSLGFLLAPPWIYGFLVVPVALVLVLFQFLPGHKAKQPVQGSSTPLPAASEKLRSSVTIANNIPTPDLSEKQQNPSPPPAPDRRPPAASEKKQEIVATPPAREKRYPFVAERKAAGQTWLSNGDGGRFTLQLMSLTAQTAEKNLETILADPSVAFFLQETYVIEKTDPPHTVYIFYGSFNTTQEARRVLQSLPPPMASGGAFVIKKAGAATKSGITALRP